MRHCWRFSLYVYYCSLFPLLLLPSSSSSSPPLPPPPSPPLLFLLFPSSSSSATDGSHKHKKMKLHTSLTASDSSTIAEEVVVLLRRLHPLPAWNPLINKYISTSLQSIPRIILSTSAESSAHLRKKRKEGLREEQVRVLSS